MRITGSDVIELLCWKTYKPACLLHSCVCPCFESKKDESRTLTLQSIFFSYNLPVLEFMSDFFYFRLCLFIAHKQAPMFHLHIALYQTVKLTLCPRVSAPIYLWICDTDERGCRLPVSACFFASCVFLHDCVWLSGLKERRRQWALSSLSSGWQPPCERRANEFLSCTTVIKFSNDDDKRCVEW